MHYSRLTPVLLASIATLSLMAHAPSAGAQGRPMPVHPAPTMPVQTPTSTLPERLVLPPWQFANIRASLVGPQTVRIDWMPLPNADQYQVYRNQIPLGAPYAVPPNASQPLSFTDTSAPPNSTVTYYVSAAQKASTPEVAPGQLPTSGQLPTKNPPKLLNYERFMANSNPVAIITQGAAPATWPPGAWQPALAARQAVVPLQGFVDLHVHPMSYLGFGGKLLYGAPDFVDQSKNPPDPPDMQELPPAPCNPNSGYATSEDQALGHENDFYGGPRLLPPPLPPVPGPCTNPARETVILAIQASLLLTQAQWPPQSFGSSGTLPLPNPLWSGPPFFPTWPTWNDALRQKMYVDWLKRAYDGGLRIMVALAVNSKLLGDVVLASDANRNADLPTDDLHSADLQIAELHAFVNRHAFVNGRPWMTIVRNSAELYQAVSKNQLAIVVGMEIDNIGSLGTVAGQNVTQVAINNEIDRLYAEDVRYIFPVHLVDNPIGKSAAYDPTFTLANLYEEHALMHLSCAQPSDNIQWSYDAALQKLTYLLNSGVPGLSMPATTNCPNGVINAGDRDAQGNVIGLSAQGAVAIQHMMDRGMLIDVDHMSQASVSQTISLAKSRLPVNYPLFSGHNNLRGSAGPGSFKERQLTPQQYKDIGSLHGMAGIGAANTDAQAWLSTLSQTVSAMNVGNLPVIAFGTDADGMEFMMPPRAGSAVNPATPLPPPAIPLTLSHDGTRTWDYNHDGVAHYGLLPDFLLDVASLQSQGGPSVVVQMFNGAQSFYDTWYLAELDKKF